MQDDDTWVVNHFVDGKLGCNAVCWAPLNCIGYRDETGRQYMHLVTGSCDNRVKVNLTKLLLSEKAVRNCKKNSAYSNVLSSYCTGVALSCR